MSNKWLSDMQTLKTTTNLLRGTLSDSGVSVTNTDTLPQLVNKVPLLAPITVEGWSEDSLWVFPDPNGTQTSKTIRQIYDEDTTTGFTYRAICMINGEHDTIEICGHNEIPAGSTLILSDGTTYTNVGGTTIQTHTWDTTKDVIDSKGRKMRYIRVYSNTATSYLPNFDLNVVWGIYRLGGTIGSGYGYTGLTGSSVIERLDLESSYTSVQTNYASSGFSHQYSNVRKIVNNTNVQTGYARGLFKNCIRLEIAVNYDSQSDTGYVCNLRQILSFKTGLTSFSWAGDYLCPNLATLDLSLLPSTVTTITLSQLPCGLKQLIFPTDRNITLTIGGASGSVKRLESNMKTLTIPSNVTSFTIGAYSSYTYPAWEKIIIQSSPDAIYNINFNNMSLQYLKEFIVPGGWKYSISLSNAPNLEHDSMVDMFDNLADLTGQTAKTLTLGSTNLNKLTAEEKAIATSKNWTLS